MSRRQIQPTGEIIITVESTERHFPFETLSVGFDSPADEILRAVQPVVLEDTGVDIFTDGENLYTVKKIEESGNVYVFPKSPAGH